MPLVNDHAKRMNCVPFVFKAFRMWGIRMWDDLPSHLVGRVHAGVNQRYSVSVSVKDELTGEEHPIWSAFTNQIESFESVTNDLAWLLPEVTAYLLKLQDRVMAHQEEDNKKRECVVERLKKQVGYPT